MPRLTKPARHTSTRESRPVLRRAAFTTFLARLNIEVADVQRVRLDELSARLDLVAHEGREDVVRLVGVLDLHLQERAALGIHGRLPELARIHLAEALVALDLEPL